MFNLQIATQIVAQNDNFPVDFDDLWQWCGYSRKDNAKTTLVKNFEEGFDFQLLNPKELRPQGGYSNREEIKLTLDSAKEFAMLAQTEQGKNVRRYFIEAEKFARQQSQPELPEKDSRYHVETAEKIANLENPILKAALAQMLAEEMGCKSLPPAESDRIVAVNVRAKELGISQSLITEAGQKGYWSLGSCIAREFTPEEGKVPLGSYLVNAYKVSEELDKAILAYFEL